MSSNTPIRKIISKNLSLLIFVYANPDLRYALTKSIIGKANSGYNSEKHILLAITWILRTQSFTVDGGIPSSVSLNTKCGVRCQKSCPVATGSLISTMFDYYFLTKKRIYFKSALLMANSVILKQHSSGYFSSEISNSKKRGNISDCGKIICGLNRAYMETKEPKFLNAIVRASDWIVSMKKLNSSWEKYGDTEEELVIYDDVNRALLGAYEITDNYNYKKITETNLHSFLNNQENNGWFSNIVHAEKKGCNRFSNRIGNTLEDLVESGLISGNQKYIDGAKVALHRLFRKFEISGELLAGRFNKEWNSTVKSVSISDCAQISICWQRLYQIEKDIRYFNAALKMNDILKKHQFLSGSKIILGSLPSSYPLWGDFGPYSIDSSSIKYFIESLVHEVKIFKSLSSRVK